MRHAPVLPTLSLSPMQALLAVPLLLSPGTAAAQAFCSSDGQAEPLTLVERFHNADCAACWARPDAPLPAGAVALDWVLPGMRQGDDAPLAAVARRDGLDRLAALGLPVPAASAEHRTTVGGGVTGANRSDADGGKPASGGSKSDRRTRSTSAAAAAGSSPPVPGLLRVAHGLPVNEYMGVTVALLPMPPAVAAAAVPTTGASPQAAGASAATAGATGSADAAAAGAPHTVWLALLERLPAGSDSTPVARNLVRNAFQHPWMLRSVLSKDEQNRWLESRSMALAESAQPARLAVVGWLQDAQGRVVAAAQSACAVEAPGGGS